MHFIIKVNRSGLYGAWSVCFPVHATLEALPAELPILIHRHVS
jgi:hypothetical protein